MAARLTCPCGHTIYGATDAALVGGVRGHLAERHPGREYADEEILMMATPIPDRLLPAEDA